MYPTNTLSNKNVQLKYMMMELEIMGSFTLMVKMFIYVNPRRIKKPFATI